MGTDMGRVLQALGRFAGAILILAGLGGCGESGEASQRLVDGNPDLGKVAILHYDCGVCHTIPGVRGAEGTVGPPLTDFGLRTYIAGVAPNRPGLLVRWIQDPPAIAPDTAMPNLGVSDEEARHIAAYLYTLR